MLLRVDIIASTLLLMHSLVSSMEIAQRSIRGKYPSLQLFRHLPIPAKEPRELFLYHGFSEQDISSMEGKFPQLFEKIQVEKHLSPKLAFAQAVMLHGYRKSITEFPFYFSYDLEQVIAVRCAYMECLGYNVSSDLSSFLPCSDEEFTSRFPSTMKDVDFYQFRRNFLRGGLHAARDCDVDSLDQLLRYGYDPSSDIDRQGRTVLHWVCGLGRKQGAVEIARMLVEEGRVDPLARAHDGSTTMMWAATGGSLALFQYLHRLGSDPFIPDNEGSTAFMWAAGSGAVEICRWINDLAINSERSSPASTTNKFGCLAIHFAASGGQIESIRYLIELCGINTLTQSNLHGHDSLTKAVAFKQPNAVRLICSELMPYVRPLILQPRPWDDDRLNLIQIAELVSCKECLELLQLALAGRLPRD